MREVDMKKKICPIMSPAPRAMVDDMFILCQGSACLAFGSRRTYEYLGKDDKAQLSMGSLQTFNRDDESPELKSLLAQGWERSYPQYTGSSFRREIEPECWCDAMPANFQCGYEAP